MAAMARPEGREPDPLRPVTLTLRARLAVIATIVSGLLLGGLSVVSYNVLARWLIGPAAAAAPDAHADRP